MPYDLDLPSLPAPAGRSAAPVVRGLGALFTFLGRLDLDLAQAISGWRPAVWPRVTLATITWAASGWIYAAAAAWLLIEGGGRALQSATFGALLGNVVLVAVKRRVRRLRPCDRLPTGAREPERFAGDRYSFPSGHCVNAFALATVLAGWAPAAGPAVVVAATLIGASRIALGLHFLTDAVAGAALGALAAGCSITLVGL